MKVTSLCLFLFFSITFLHAQTNEYFKGEVFDCKFQVNSMDMSKDDNQILLGGENKMVVLYGIAQKKVLFEKEAHYLPVAQVIFSNLHDGFYTVGDKSIRLWINGKEEPEKIFLGSHTSITDVEFSADEAYVVGGSYEKKFRYWDAALPEEPKTIETDQKRNVISVALSSDNKLIAAGSLDSSIEIWETTSFTRKIKLLAHAGPVCCVKFINNNTELLSASHDGYIKRWDVATGKSLNVYAGHTQPISNIAVSPNGKYFLSASYDHTLALYAIKTGDKICDYKHHESPVIDVKWNSKGDGFFSVDEQGKVAEWIVPKKVYVDFYYGVEMDKEMQENRLFRPKEKGESKDDYKNRQEKAEQFKFKLIDKYYELYKVKYL